MLKIDITDIRKRKSILAESSEISNTINISNAYEKAKSDKYEDIRNFVKECGSSRYNANEYLKPCIEFVERSDNPELLTIFKSEVLPRVNDYELNYAYESYIDSPLAGAIHEQIVRNKVVDRIIANHSNIMKQGNVESIFEDRALTLSNKTKSLCETIDKFEDIPVYAKVNITLEESAYLTARFLDESDYNPLRDVVEYYCISHDLTENDIKQINTVLKENYLVEDIRDMETSKSTIVNMVDKYISRSEHNPYELSILHSKVLSASETDWVQSCEKYWRLLIQIATYGATEEIKEAAVKTLSSMNSSVVERFGGSTQFKNVIKANIEVISKIIPEIATTNLNLVSVLNEQLDAFNDYNKIAYTRENVEYIIGPDSILNEATIIDRMTLYEFGDRKRDPLLIKFGKFDKMLQREIRGWVKKQKDKVVDTVSGAIEKIEDKMYEEVSIYDMIVGNHIDYVVASYYYPADQDMDKLHERCTNLVKTFNESELKDTSAVAYYTLESGIINFCIKDNTELILSEDESLLANEMISTEDIDNLSESLFFANCIDENFDLFNKATEFFINNPTEGYFETFCDACSMAGVLQETVQDIYDYVKVRTNSQFVSQNSYYMNIYKENSNTDIYTQTGALLALQAMLEDTKPVKKETKPEPKKDSKLRVKVTPTVKNSKVTPNTKNSKETVNTKTSDIKEKKGVENPLAKLKLNDLKLYVAGLKKNMKDLDNKTQTAVRNMDFMVEKLIKDMKGALISDRRESIIKGSVIPSFHKCILIAVGLAGLAWFNAPLAVITAIGGFAASKKLTERERALMLDDIEIELELLEKEIQMADSRNQIKKMRQLMKMKKNLQREYQRIKYNIRLGKDIVPSGSYLPSKD